MNSTTLPGANGWPLIGNLPEFARDPLAFLDDLKRKHGDVARFSLGRSPSVLLSHPNDVGFVLLETGKSFHKGYQQGFSTPLVLGNGLVTSEGDFWRRQRKLSQPAFHAQRIGSYAQTMVQYALEMLDNWQPGQHLDAHTEMMHLTQRIVAQTLFGQDTVEQTAELGIALDTIMREMDAEFTTLEGFVPGFVPTPSRTRLTAAVRQIEQLIVDVTQSRRQSRDQHADLLEMLLQARDDDGKPMTDQQLRDEIITLYIAGHETTSNTLAWTWVLLAQHPSVRAKLEAELERVLSGRVPTFDDLRALTYTNAIIKESMRVRPPVWSISRVASVDVQLREYTIPKGTEIWLAQWVTHRDPRWFDDPLAFRPERWLEGPEQLEKRIPRHAYFPFGGGPRICIGNSFAQMEAVLLLATIAQQFRLTLRSDAQITPLASMTLRPKHGVAVRLEVNPNRRNPA
jgi:cytochrome P450